MGYLNFLLVQMMMGFHLPLKNQMLDDNLVCKLLDIVHQVNLKERRRCE